MIIHALSEWLWEKEEQWIPNEFFVVWPCFSPKHWITQLSLSESLLLSYKVIHDAVQAMLHIITSRQTTSSLCHNVAPSHAIAPRHAVFHIIVAGQIRLCHILHTEKLFHGMEYRYWKKAFVMSLSLSFLLCSRQLTNSELPTNASQGEMVIDNAASKYVYDYTHY